MVKGEIGSRAVYRAQSFGAGNRSGRAGRKGNHDLDQLMEVDKGLPLKEEMETTQDLYSCFSGE